MSTDERLYRQDVVRLLRQADSSGTLDLRDRNLERISLASLNLRHAKLSNANLRGTDLSGANLSEADLTLANLKGAIGISTKELEEQAKSLKDATMPDGTIHP